MKHICLYWVVLSTCILFPSCKTKTVDISIGDVSIDIQERYFQGIQPDIEYSLLVNHMGAPMDFLDLPGDYDEREHSPMYYLDDGKVICHWGGDEDELIGMIEFIPYNSDPIDLASLLCGSLSDYRIKTSTRAVRVYHNNVLYYRLKVDNYRIKSIEYWMAKRSFLNVAY